MLPFLCSGVILAIFNNLGNIPNCIHLLKILASGSEMYSADIFINLIGIFSIPTDFFSFKLIIFRNILHLKHGSQNIEFVMEGRECEGSLLCRKFEEIFDAIFGPMLIK